MHGALLQLHILAFPGSPHPAASTQQHDSFGEILWKLFTDLVANGDAALTSALGLQGAQGC